MERHDALPDTLLLQQEGLNWEPTPSTTAQPDLLPHTFIPDRVSAGNMTTKNRSKNSEKSAASSQDDAPKKSQKSGGATNGVSGPEGPQGPRSGSCLGLLVTTVFYIAMIGAAGFAAFYLQQVVEEVRQIHAKHEESARRSGEMGTKMESFVQQVRKTKQNMRINENII